MSRVNTMLVAALAKCLCAASLSQEKSPDEAMRFNQRAVDLYRSGKFSEAIPLAERSLTIREKALGPDHPTVATSAFKGEDRADALRAAQLEMIARDGRSHPFYWASFILPGAIGPIKSTQATG